VRILCFSDVHENFEKMFELISNSKADLILFCGDLCLNGGKQESVSFSTHDLLSQISIPFFWVHGNHDDNNYLSSQKPKNLIKPGKIVDFNGLKIAGLGGNFSPKKFDIKRNIIETRFYHFILKEDIEKFKESNIDIFLSHDSPKALRKEGCCLLDDLIKKMHPKLCLSGHHHQFKTLEKDGVIYLSLPAVVDGGAILMDENLEII